MKQHTMVAMMATNRRMEEAMPAKVVGLRGEKRRGRSPVTKHCFCFFDHLASCCSSFSISLCLTSERIKVEVSVIWDALFTADWPWNHDLINDGHPVSLYPITSPQWSNKVFYFISASTTHWSGASFIKASVNVCIKLHTVNNDPTQTSMKTAKYGQTQQSENPNRQTHFGCVPDIDRYLGHYHCSEIHRLQSSYS